VRTGLARVYSGTLRLADWLAARRGRLGFATVALATLGLAAINRLVLVGFPNSGDEYAYLYEASTFAAGRLWNQAPLLPEFFALNYVVIDGERAFSSFPIGWPLALAGAMSLGVPASLVNPILGGLTLAALAALGTRLYDVRTGVLAALLVGVSPFFLFNGASYFSHTFCGLLLVTAAYVASREDRSPAWVPLAVGFLVGWAVLTRHLTGVVCAVPIVCWLLRSPAPGAVGLRRGHRRRCLWLVCLGGLPWMAALAWYNDALTGDPLRLTTTPLTLSLWFRPGWVLRGADILATHLLRHLLWTPPLLVALYLFYLRTSSPGLRRGAIEWMPILIVVALYGYVERGGNQYGPRFHYEAFLFMAPFVAANVFREPAFDRKPASQRWAFGLLAASLAALPLSFATHAVIERRVIEERMDPYTSVRESGLRNALVLIGGRVGTERSMPAEDLTRNGIDYSGPVLYGLDVGRAENCAVSAAYEGRTPYLYVWDRARGDGVLSPITCASLPPPTSHLRPPTSDLPPPTSHLRPPTSDPIYLPSTHRMPPSTCCWNSGLCQTSSRWPRAV
jgi:hypothetical protein